MTLMMKRNLIRNKKELNRKLLLLYQESINQFERLLKMIKCCFKTKFSQSSHLKESYGLIQKSRAVSHLNLKDHFIINVQHLQTLPAARKDSHYNLQVRELDLKLLFHYQSGILVTSLSTLNILTKLQLKTKVTSIASISSFLMKLHLDQNSNFQRQKACLEWLKINESLSI